MFYPHPLAALVSLKNVEDVKILTEKDRAIEDLQKTIEELVCEQINNLLSVLSVNVGLCGTLGPFKCYVMLFPRKFDPHPLPRNTNNVES